MNALRARSLFVVACCPLVTAIAFATDHPPFEPSPERSNLVPATLSLDLEFIDDDEPAELPDNQVGFAHIEIAPPWSDDETEYAEVDVEQVNGSYYNASNSMILERLESLEYELYHMKNAALLADDGAEESTLDIGGRIHLDNWSFLNSSTGIGFMEHPPMMPATAIDGTDPENRWAFRRFRFELKGTHPDDIFWRFQIDFANPPREVSSKMFTSAGTVSLSIRKS